MYEKKNNSFRKDGADERDIITEKKSGKNVADRPEYLAMRDHMLREGDTLVIMSLDRLGRNKSEIKQELQFYKDHHIRVRILDLPTSNAKVESGQEWIIDISPASFAGLEPMSTRWHASQMDTVIFHLNNIYVESAKMLIRQKREWTRYGDQ